MTATGINRDRQVQASLTSICHHIKYVPMGRQMIPFISSINVCLPQLQQEILSARRQIESQATQILSLEAALDSRPALPPDAPESDKDRLMMEQARTIKELEIVLRGYEDNLGEPLRAVREDVEKEWKTKLEVERKSKEEKELWGNELVRQLEREKQVCCVPSIRLLSPLLT
jgi:hypothetical protein